MNDRDLVKLANDVRRLAYAPYSEFPVGAALLCADGTVVTGVNIENAVNGLSLCAERVALFKAISEGEVEFDMISVVTDNGGSPCGACRQVLSEFGRDTIVLIADGNGKLMKTISVRELLPEAFGPRNLKDR